MEDSQPGMDLSNPQEQPIAAVEQEDLTDCNLNKSQEMESMDNVEDMKEHNQSNEEAGEPELIHIQQLMFCTLEKGQVIQCQIELSNPRLEEGAGGVAREQGSNRKLCGASRDDVIKVKGEYSEREESALNSEPMENLEESELPYTYPREYNEYESIKLERHSGSYDNVRPASGKMNCDICGLACISLNVLMVHKRSHTVEKPYKCEFCGRSYKQRSSLEEHKERCRTYLQNAGMCEAGEKRPSFDVNYNSSFLYEKESEMMHGRMMDQAINNAITYLGAEALRPLVQTPPAPTAEMVPVISSLYPLPLPRADVPNGTAPEAEKSHGHLRDKSLSSDRGLSPNNSGHDSTDTDSNHEERPNPTFHQSQVIPAPSRNGLQALKDFPRPYDIIKPPAICPRDAFKVINKEGEAIGVYRCDHCRVLFLDYVMFTIHMGCHGFRDPFECNVCGYRSHDRYEFSSHIARGEHRVVLK
ncbi:Zinc finger protein Aiolos [Lonchura striata]|uniref:Zinc finger protein Aiolos n=1 Tax=Lonchura striata TaxID=40157 RepID=A0A218UMF1_9PASE|nr:Zinc finger protein Aiolos [Lonchura striata domestica]